MLQIWEWQGAGMREAMSVGLPSCLGFRPLSGDRYFAQIKPKVPGHWPLVVGSLPSCDPIKTWPDPQGWRYDRTGTSRNGKFAAVTLEHDIDDPPPGLDFRVRAIRVALIDVTTLEMQHVSELRTTGARSLGTVAVSDDGKYIALAGWDSGVAMVDTERKKVLWSGREKGATYMAYASFSRDASAIYVGETCGFVYKKATKTGKVLRRLCATETGKPIYGHRISCIAVSPDNSWVAVGTGPEGLVFAWNTKSDDIRPLVFPHGLITTLALSFSPDSTHLATWGGGKIKIWKLPEQQDGADETKQEE